MESFEIYPQFRKDTDDLEEQWAYFCYGLERMVPFVNEAAERDSALLVYIN